MFKVGDEIIRTKLNTKWNKILVKYGKSQDYQLIVQKVLRDKFLIFGLLGVFAFENFKIKKEFVKEFKVGDKVVRSPTDEYWISKVEDPLAVYEITHVSEYGELISLNGVRRSFLSHFFKKVS